MPGGQTASSPQPSTGVTIVGTVVNVQLEPISGVALALERAGQVAARTTTNPKGEFRFSNIASGNYQVRATAAGFPAFVRDIKVPASLPVFQLPLVMSKPADELKSMQIDQIQTVALPPSPPPAVSGAGAAIQVQGAAAAGGRGGAGLAARSIVANESMQDRVIDQRYRPEPDDAWSGYRYPQSRDKYAHVAPNQFKSARNEPLSTFGADVDTASYANSRRFLSTGALPPKDAVRVEEFLNYFRFDYDEPRNSRPIALTTEVGDCPWAPSHKLVLIGARARAASTREIEGRNIVLLVDVSGSMQPADRLPLLKTALGMFVDTLRADDRIAIVTYAGYSGVVLPSTPAKNRDVIQRAIAGLGAGGSTNGAQGIVTAYRVAREAFIPGGVNRVILATDGDFNVGVTSHDALLDLIERQKESGVFLSVFGVGTGNLMDATMEMLADKGNGHYAYLDSLQEARRILIRESDSTLETVAKDVKFQVEFNPARVSAWKLIGYENRIMAAEDFNNDRKDGGEMGAGHTVTMLYEVIPAGAKDAGVDALKYQGAEPPAPAPAGQFANEWLTVKARYKTPEGEKSELMTQPVAGSSTSLKHLPFASAVAEFGMLLRSGERNAEQWTRLADRASRLSVAASQAADADGFKELISIAKGLARLR